jgi:hypothetical protein
MDFSRHCVQTCSGTSTGSYSTGTGALFSGVGMGVNRPDPEADHSPPLLPTLRMLRDIPPHDLARN